MKFELEPDNRNCPDEELLNDLFETAKKLNKQALTKDEYSAHGRFCAATMQKRFGSWNKALIKSGLNQIKQMNIPENELLEDIICIARKMNKKTISTIEYRAMGKFSVRPIKNAFGSWGNALKKAGLEPTGWKPPATEEELFNNMANVWEHIGRQPKRNDLRLYISLFGPDAYTNRFGSWRNALEIFVKYANSNDYETDSAKNTNENPTLIVEENKDIKHKTSRHINWRLRFLVMNRDNFKCKCGRSPAKNPEIELHVDHIKPYSKGGETIFENLQTLCSVCNIGKSDLE